MSDVAVALLLLCAASWCFYAAMTGINNDREKYKQLCAKHNLEYVDWNTNAISCFDPKTNAVKAFKNES